MPLTDTFDGDLASGQSVTVITAAGAGTTVPIHGVENIQWPQRSYKEDKYTPLTGTQAGKEKVLLCSAEAGELTATLTYDSAHQVAMDAICGTNGCQITLVLADGLTLVANGGIKKLGHSRMEDSKHISDDISISMDAGWLLTEGTAKTIVPTYTVTMAAGSASIDLTACGAAGNVNLTGLEVTKLVLIAGSTNSNAVTVAVGASNGYDIIGTFSEILSAGQAVTIEPGAAAPTVGATEKIFDVTGTLAQTVSVYLEARTPA